MAECELVTNRVDYSDEEAVAAIIGAGVGGVAVVGATTVVMAGAAASGGAAMGAMALGTVFLPLLGAGMVIGAQKNKSKTNAKEQKLRALVWNKCLMERGYTVLSEGWDLE